MNRSILIVICDFLVLSVLSLSSGMGEYRSSVPVNYVDEMQISKMMRNLHTTKLRLKSTEQELLDAAQKLAKTETSLNATAQELAETETSLSATAQELQKTKEKHGETEQSLNVAQKEIKLSKKQIANSEKKLSDHAKTIEIKREKINVVSKELAQTKSALASTEGELSTTKNNLRSTVAILTAAKVELTYKQKEISHIKNRLGQTEEKLMNANDKLINTQGRLISSTNKLSYAQGRLDAMEKELSETQLRLDCSISELSDTKVQFKTAENKLNSMKGVLTSAVSELSQTKGKLENTKEELDTTKDTLTTAKLSLTETTGALSATKQDLSHTQKKLNETEKQLKTDVFKVYDNATVKLVCSIMETRWFQDYKFNKTWFLPQVAIGKNTYIIADFSDLMGIKNNWVNHNRIYFLKYAVFPPTGELQETKLAGPIVSLAEDKRVCMIPMPQSIDKRKPLMPITFKQLKERGLTNIYLFKKNSFGKGSCDLGSRCSISLTPGDKYLYVSNPPRKSSETKAEVGDFLLTKDGRFVGIILNVKTDSIKKTEEAKCFVFPSQIDLAQSIKIPIIKKPSQKYYKNFMAFLNRVNEAIKKSRPKSKKQIKKI